MVAKKQQDTTLAVVTHILAYFTWVIGPLVVLLAADDAFSRNNARAALNWQISLTIYFLVSLVLVLVLVGILFLLVLGLLDLIFVILAAVKASKGEVWEYPVTIPFLKLE